MEELQRQVKAAWKQFWDHSEVKVDGIREEIVESWKRSKAYGVNPYHMEKMVLSPEELKERIRKNQNLYDVTVPFMNTLHSFEKGAGFLALLCDADGYVLKIFGEEDTIAAVRGNLLVEGACRNEKSIGTNAIGTCIYLKKSLSIIADEHYYKPHNMWSCTAAPILNSEGQLVGALCLSAYWDRVTYHTLGLVVAATEAISRQLALVESLDRLAVVNFKLGQVLELMSYGVIIVKKNGVITQINSLAIQLLKLKKKDKDEIIGTSICGYLPREVLDLQKILDDNPAGETEFNAFLGTLHCTALPLVSEGERTSEVVVTIRKTEHVYKMVNQIVGSNASFTLDDIVGESEAIREVKNLTEISAPYMSNVLLTGESGTGKELFAQAIHNLSPRANAPFVALNCGALPRSLIESELFGYEGGAFTSSKKEGQAGKFELANGGTIFLDEIGDMPFDVQANLLRVLQNREVVRIGGKKAIQIDVRVVAATNKDLTEAIDNNSFRKDLYYRLNVFSINIPPLRERKGDVRLLCDYMLQKYAASFGKQISGFDEDAYRMLEQYNWPGNVRELENCVERSVLIAHGKTVTASDLSGCIDISDRTATQSKPKLWPASMAEEELIRNAMDVHKGNIRAVSRDLGLSRGTLYRKIKKYNIDLGGLRV